MLHSGIPVCNANQKKTALAFKKDADFPEKFSQQLIGLLVLICREQEPVMTGSDA